MPPGTRLALPGGTSSLAQQATHPRSPTRLAVWGDDEARVNRRDRRPARRDLRRESEVLVNPVFDRMTEALARGERIEVRGFGIFVVKRRRERVGRNPKTGNAVKVQAKRVALFKTGKELKLRLDSNGVRT